MNVIFKGYRCIFDGEAVAIDYVSVDFQKEKIRKIRTLLGNWQLLTIMPSLLHPRRNPIFLQYVSHKVLRLIIPFCFINYLFASFFIDGLFYQLCFWLTLFFFIIPFFESLFIKNKIAINICKLSRTVLNLNVFALLSFIYFISGKKDVWK